MNESDFILMNHTTMIKFFARLCKMYIKCKKTLALTGERW